MDSGSINRSNFDKKLESDSVNLNVDSSNNQEEDLLRLVARYLNVFWLHKWVFAFIFILTFSAVILYRYRQQDFFVCEYEIFYNESAKEIISDSDVPVIKSTFDKVFWLSKLKSDEVISMTLERSGLPYSLEYLQSVIKVDPKDVKGSSTAIFKVTLTTTKNRDIPLIFNAYFASINKLLENFQMENTYRLVNFLSGQLADNNSKLNLIDRKILSGDLSNPAALRDYSKMITELENFRVNLLNAQIELSSVKASRVRTEQELVNLDGTIINETAFSEPLKVQLMNLQVDLARALTKNREEHPTVISLRENISHINQMLKDSIQQQMQIQSFVKNPLKEQLMSKLMDLKLSEISLETRVNSLNSVIEDYEYRIMPDTTDVSARYLREREMILININQINNKILEAQSAAHVNLGRFIVIDEPCVPEIPANRPFLFFIAIAFVLALIVACGLIFVYDLLDNRLVVPADFESFFRSIPIVGYISSRKDYDSNIYNLFDLDKSYKKLNDFSEIVLKIKMLNAQNGAKVFSFTSPLREEGKSLTSLHLAVALANRKLNVLLIDTDFFKPRLSTILGHELNPGLVHYLSGVMVKEDLFYSTDLDTLSFTPAGRTKYPSRYSYDNRLITEFINRARDMYDIIIVDIPASLLIPDTISILINVDYTFLLCRMRHTSRASLDRLLALMGRDRDKIAGAVLTDVKESSVLSGKYNYKKYESYYS